MKGKIIEAIFQDSLIRTVVFKEYERMLICKCLNTGIFYLKEYSSEQFFNKAKTIKEAEGKIREELRRSNKGLSPEEEYERQYWKDWEARELDKLIQADLEAMERAMF
jgi:hypothetical protein